MEKVIEEKTALYFRIFLVLWVWLANAILSLMGFAYGWLIFISNIMMFTMEGPVKERFISVELGGLVGLLCTVGMMLVFGALAPAVGDLWATLIPLAVILVILIIFHPYAPKVLNNVGFAYLTCACIDTDAFAAHTWQFIGVFIVGSLIFNTVSLLLMKPASALAVKTAKAKNT